jgi:hypothetical protein
MHGAVGDGYSNAGQNSSVGSVQTLFLDRAAIGSLDLMSEWRSRWPAVKVGNIAFRTAFMVFKERGVREG